jgi:hypothetical protein
MRKQAAAARIDVRIFIMFSRTQFSPAGFPNFRESGEKRAATKE